MSNSSKQSRSSLSQTPSFPLTIPFYYQGTFHSSARKKRVQETKEKRVTLISQSSTSDLSKAISAARSGYKAWASLVPSKRGRQLFEFVELLDAKKEQLVKLLRRSASVSEDDALEEAQLCIERAFWYAGWCDKITSLYSSMNAVSLPYQSVTTPGPTGVVGVILPEMKGKGSCLNLISAILPIIASGNSVVVLTQPTTSGPVLQLICETLHCSKLPQGVVNILFGDLELLGPTIVTHEEVDGISVHTTDDSLLSSIREACGNTLISMEIYDDDKKDLFSHKGESPYRILSFVQYKTIWQPVVDIQGGGSGY